MLDFSIAIHSGAGTILKEEMTAELENVNKNSPQQVTMAEYRINARKSSEFS